MSTVYQSFSFSTAPIWDRVPVGAIGHYHWESDTPYRPKSFFQLCFVKDKGVFVRLWSDETDLRAVCTDRDDPVWEDSCLECFLQPVPGGGYLTADLWKRCPANRLRQAKGSIAFAALNAATKPPIRTSRRLRRWAKIRRAFTTRHTLQDLKSGGQRHDLFSKNR